MVLQLLSYGGGGQGSQICEQHSNSISGSGRLVKACTSMLGCRMHHTLCMYKCLTKEALLIECKACTGMSYH